MIGHGQSFKFGETTLPHITNIQVQDQGNILSSVVADLAYQKRDVAPGTFGFTVDLEVPATGVHTLEGILKSGSFDDFECISGGVKYTGSKAISGGYTKSSPSGGKVAINVTFAVDGSVTLAAPS